MDEGARLWLVKTAKKHFWRVSRWHDLDDLIQEGYFAYQYSIYKYPDANAPQHRMALFKKIFMSRLHDMANARTRAAAEVCEADLRGGDDESFDQPLSQFAAPAELESALPALATAPQYVRDALALFGSDEGLARLRSGYRKKTRGRWTCRETLNERLCRLTGYDPKVVDIVAGIRACLSDR
jgi:hypothetical protein